MPATPRFDIRATCIDAPWPERGLRGRVPQRRTAPIAERTDEEMPKFMRDLTALDLALLRKLNEFPDAYHAVMEERRRLEEGRGP